MSKKDGGGAKDQYWITVAGHHILVNSATARSYGQPVQHHQAAASAHDVHKAMKHAMKGLTKEGRKAMQRAFSNKPNEGKGRTKALAGPLGYSKTGGQTSSVWY